MESGSKKFNFSGRQRNFFFKKYRLLLLVAAIIIIFTAIWSFLSSTSSVFQFAFSQNRLKSTDDRINVLLLGIAGGIHDGATLTDSIIVASYHMKSHKVTLISIPRDLWLEGAKGKVNTVYQNKGLKYAEDKIDDILGLPIHYGIRLDFSGFTKAIDQVGGVDVEVPNTFDDFNYPITGKENDRCGLLEKEVDLTEDQVKQMSQSGSKLSVKAGKNKLLVDSNNKIATQSSDFSCRFEHIHFDKAMTHMDGVTALKFVRSRMGTNGEGSDFARSRRQQLVIQAFREKALSLETLFNPQRVIGLINTFGRSIETDIETDRILDFYSLTKKVDGVNNLVLGDLGEGKSILVVPPPFDYGGSFVLIPPNNDFSPVIEFTKAELQKQAQIK